MLLLLLQLQLYFIDDSVNYYIYLNKAQNSIELYENEIEKE